MAASAIHATSRSSISIVITAATASPKAPRRSRCVRSRPICSAIWGRGRGRWDKQGDGCLTLPHEFRAQHQPLDSLVPAVDFLIVTGQADRLDDGADLQRQARAFYVEVSHENDRVDIGEPVTAR